MTNGTKGRTGRRGAFSSRPQETIATLGSRNELANLRFVRVDDVAAGQ